MTFSRSVAVREAVLAEAGHPFDLPLIRALPELDLSAPVTFFAGENGSGKSTPPRSRRRLGRSRWAPRRSRPTRGRPRPGGWPTTFA